MHVYIFGRLLLFFRGIVAVIFAFVLFGVTNMPDGPFRRPHPGKSGLGPTNKLEIF
jgi:hypothetical protein